jgi:hypothetical protein
MSRGSWGVRQVLQRQLSAGWATRAAGALAAALLIIAVAPAASNADVLWGNSLQGSPNVTKEATADSVYWMATFADGTSGAAPTAGTVKSVTVRGYWTGKGKPQIAFQVLRPQPDGSLLVVATSQLFELPNTLGTYTFTPTGMTVQAGDFIGIATIGGSFLFAANAPGATTNDFTGHNLDMNGDSLRPTAVEKDVELLVQVDLVPAASPNKEKPPPKERKVVPKPCKCQKISVKLDGTLLNKRRLRSDKHDFGVGFTWRMTCSKGTGGCTAVLGFQPPVIRAGTLPKVPGLKLNLKRLTFVCKSACHSSTTGRFEIKMNSRSQLNKLFGRTLAFTVTTSCGGVPFRYPVRVFVDNSGGLHRAR